MNVKARTEVCAYHVMHQIALVRIGDAFTPTSSCEPRTEKEVFAQADFTGERCSEGVTHPAAILSLLQSNNTRLTMVQKALM